MEQDSQEVLPSPILNAASLGLDMKRSLFKAKVNGLPTPTGPSVIANSKHSSFSEPPKENVSVSSSEAITKSLTHYLLQTYLNSNPNYSYQPVNNPRRVLTKPSKPTHNNGHDNENWDYILYVNDLLGAQEGHQYQILDLLGQGTFGQVVKCQNIKTKEFLAIKVIKNKPSYYNQSLVEVTMLEMLNKNHDPQDKHHIVRMRDQFVFRNHLCIGFEILSVNLYELIKKNRFVGLSTKLVKIFVAQMLDSLTVLHQSRIVHCDLKPENILLKTLDSPSIKVIDFGSACFENQTVYTYIQSRFYRSPEILLGLPYTTSIDMWSLGCIAAEIFLGLPIFPGTSEYNQISRIVEMLGIPPSYMCGKGKATSKFFNIVNDQSGRTEYSLKSIEQYTRETGLKEAPSKKYFKGTTLPEIINSYPMMRKGMQTSDINNEMQSRLVFIDFLQGILNLNPLQRWSPQQARQHPFITGEPFKGPFIPNRLPVLSHPEVQGLKPNPMFSVPSGRKFSYQPKSTADMQQFNAFSSQSKQQAEPMEDVVLSPTDPHSQGKARHNAPLNHANSESSIQVQSSWGASHSGSSGHARQGSIDSFSTHPRQGDYGERNSIPSRMPSVAMSVNWEPFQDEDGESSRLNRRQSTASDMSWKADELPLQSSRLRVQDAYNRNHGMNSHSRSLSHSSLNSPTIGGPPARLRAENYQGRRPSMQQEYLPNSLPNSTEAPYNRSNLSITVNATDADPVIDGEAMEIHPAQSKNSSPRRDSFHITQRMSSGSNFKFPVNRNNSITVFEDGNVTQESLNRRDNIEYVRAPPQQRRLSLSVHVNGADQSPMTAPSLNVHQTLEFHQEDPSKYGKKDKK